MSTTLADKPREAPHNFNAEQAVLGAILANNEALNHTEGLAPDDFYAAIHQEIYAFILELQEKGQVANPVTLYRHFKDRKDLESAYLARLVAAATSIVNIHDYARIIMDLATKRRVIAVGENAVREAFDPKSEMDGERLIESVEHQLFRLADSGRAEGGFVAVSKSLDSMLLRAENAYRRWGEVIGISTGLADVDRVLGGLHPSDLLILAGRPAMGKTALATNIAVNAAEALAKTDAGQPNPRSVGFFSLEMSADQLSMRLLAGETGVPSHAIQNGSMNQTQWTSLIEAKRHIASLPLHIDDTAALSIAAIRTRARRLKRVRNLSLLVVDYLQLVRPSHATGAQHNRVQEVSEITQGLKAIAKELDIPVIALSQLSRAVEQRDEKRPQLADLRESGSIEQDADIVMFVYRDEYYLQRAEPRPDSPAHAAWQEKMEHAANLAELIIAKHRNGPIANVTLGFEPHATKFSDHVQERHLEPQYSLGGQS